MWCGGLMLCQLCGSEAAPATELAVFAPAPRNLKYSGPHPLARPHMLTAGAGNGIGRPLFDELLLANWARFCHHVGHTCFHPARRHLRRCARHVPDLSALYGAKLLRRKVAQASDLYRFVSACVCEGDTVSTHFVCARKRRHCRYSMFRIAA